MTTLKNKSIYLLPGRRVTFSGTPGRNLVSMGCSFKGRELVGEFESERISKQLEQICNDIKRDFWSKESIIIGRSYGGYLTMHALIEFLPQKYPGRVLLLSPVLGKPPTTASYRTRPPRAKRILEYAKNGLLEGLDIEIYTGKEDNGCDYRLAEEIFSHIKSAKLHILEKEEHILSQEITNKILQKFLNKTSFR